MVWRSICWGIITVSAMSNSVAADDKLAFGEYLSGECVTCHQVSGADKGIPAIVGLDPASFIALLNAYKNKERDNKVMVTIAGALSEDEMAALAAYFATIQPTD